MRRHRATVADQQACAGQRLLREVQEIDASLAGQASHQPSFADCADRYLKQSRDLRNVEAIDIHVRVLVEHIGQLKPHEVHDGALAAFVSQPIADGIAATTINRSLEVARAILHRAGPD